MDWLTVEQIIEQMDPAYAVRVTDALAGRTAARVHDGANVLRAPASAGGEFDAGANASRPQAWDGLYLQRLNL